MTTILSADRLIVISQSSPRKEGIRGFPLGPYRTFHAGFSKGVAHCFPCLEYFGSQHKEYGMILFDRVPFGG